MTATDVLGETIEAFEGTGWAIELADPSWRLVWASNEMRTILGATHDCELGVGRHILESRRLPLFASIAGEGGAWVKRHVPYMLDDGMTVDEVIAVTDERVHDVVRSLEPRPAPPAWSFRLRLSRGLGTGTVMGLRIHDPGGALLGTAFVYGSGLPASILSWVARGDEGMFTRMQELVEPGRRQAAMIFADLQASTDLSRRMSSARYFEFITDLMYAIDTAILAQDGIVAQHAGDGVVAFFLADQVGSPSAAARAALLAAREIHDAAERLEPGCRMAVGVHWGGTLYMGQVATSGRVEVTALGDEVNECARLQEAAHGGRLLASKPLVERLDAADAEAVGLDPATLEYALVGDLPDVPEKARRDVGSIAIVEL